MVVVIIAMYKVPVRNETCLTLQRWTADVTQDRRLLMDLRGLVEELQGNERVRLATSRLVMQGMYTIEVLEDLRAPMAFSLKRASESLRHGDNPNDTALLRARYDRDWLIKQWAAYHCA